MYYEEERLDDLYAQFTCSHFNGVGQFDIKTVRQYTTIYSDELAEAVIDRAVGQGFAKKLDNGKYYNIDKLI